MVGSNNVEECERVSKSLYSPLSSDVEVRFTSCASRIEIL